MSARSAVAVQLAARERQTAAGMQRFLNAGRLAAAVSHDLLRSLGSAQSDVGFFRDLIDVPERRTDVREAAQDAHAAITEAAGRIAAVLSLARPREGELAPLDVHEVIAASLFDLEALLARHQMMCDLQPVPPALAERGALMQTVVSLLLDAVEATLPGRRIGIKLKPEGGRVVLSVEDEGPSPLAPEALAEREGSPLRICRDVVRSFGGELIISQSALGGKRVAISLLSAAAEP